MIAWTRTRTRTLRLLVVAVLVAATAACAGGTDSGADSDGVTRITWLTDEEGPAQQEMIDRFNKAHPDIRVEAEVLPFTQMLTAIPVRLGTPNAGIDVVTVDAPLTANYVSHGFLAPLDPYFSNKELEAFESNAVETGRYADHLYAVPSRTSSQVMLVNNYLLKQAGISLKRTSSNSDPQELAESRLTWEQTVKHAIRVKDRTGEWGLVFEQVDYPYQLLPLVQSLGGSGLSEDGTKADGYLNSPESVQAAQWYSDIYNKWKIAPPGVTSLQPPNMFGAGKIAFMVGGPWNSSVCEKAKFDCSVVAHPYFQGGEEVTPTGGLGMGIAATSEKKDAAATFIKWMAITENEQWVNAGGFVSAIKEDAKTQSENGAPAVRLAAYEAIHTSFPRPTTPGYKEWDAAYVKAMETIRTGGPVQATLDDAAAEIDEAMERYQ